MSVSPIPALVLAESPGSQGCTPAQTMEYTARWRQLQERISRAEPVPREDVQRFDHTLVDVAQADSLKTGRVDLTEVFHDLCLLPGVGDFFHELTSSIPDRRVLRLFGAPFEGWSQFETGRKHAVGGVTVTARQLWPETLGGVWGTEVSRTVTAHTRYAKWRDRRVRRLARVQVVAHHVVPRIEQPLRV